MTAPLPPPTGVPADDRTTLWGVLGIVLAPCCAPLGPVFAVLSLREAKKFGRRPALAYAGLVLTAVVVATYLFLYETGKLDFFGSSG